MKFIFIVLVSLFSFGNVLADNCNIKVAPVSLEYVERKTLHKLENEQHDHQRENTRKVKLARVTGRVAIEYSNTNITELWEKSSDGQLRLVKYFNRQQRGIEYQPDEIRKAIARTDWSAKWQLVPDRIKKQMTLTATKGKDCQVKQYYSLKDGDTEISLIWLPNEKIAKQYKITEANSEIEWSLEAVSFDEKEIRRYFSVLSDYQTTDYADIGDNESDPFLMKMINLGFVEHGASGFYDTRGNDIGQHRH